MTGCNQCHTPEPQHLSPCQPRRRSFKPGLAKPQAQSRTGADEPVLYQWPRRPRQKQAVGTNSCFWSPGPTVQASGIALLLHADALSLWLTPAGPTRHRELDAHEPRASQRATRFRSPALLS